MQQRPPIKHFPFVRLVFALITGIILEWYCIFSIQQIIVFGITTFVLLIVFRFLPGSKKFILGWLRGIFILVFFVFVGMIATWQQNIYNASNWYGKFYNDDALIVTLQEPLAEKANSYKATARVEYINKNRSWVATTGNVLLYFKKDSVKPALQYGSQIIFTKTLQSIKNSGNPAAFNYNRYCLFQNITAQVFLSANDYKILQTKKENIFQKLLFGIRDWALHIMRQNIHSSKELGIAEALLIGYRNDLDKDLLQAYSNTGVVHIIAISGLHIGVIYGALIFFFSLFKSSKLKRIIEPVFILLIIWMFTLVAGAAPSVSRAAVMFTFIVAGKFLGKNGNMYNTLAASAFTLLVFNPFYLWDVGFQLSYSAVFSIVLFYKSIKGLLYFKNKLIRYVWNLCAISLSAQIFTLPIVVYHFHQLPLLFLFSNLLAVPLSGLILMEELCLFCFSWWKAAASFIGWLTELCIRWMNNFIEHIDKISFSVWDGLQISIVQLIILFIVISCLSFWIFNKNNKWLLASLSFIIVFFILRDIDFIHHQNQQKVIVYNVPKQKAVDIIAGNSSRFAGDSTVIIDPFLRNFNLKPSRVKDRIYSNKNLVLPAVENFILDINASKILLLGKTFISKNYKRKIPVDILILSKNTNQSPAEINSLFQCSYIIADSSVPTWKSAKWKKEFEQLHLRFFSAAQDGAFIYKF